MTKMTQGKKTTLQSLGFSASTLKVILMVKAELPSGVLGGMGLEWVTSEQRYCFSQPSVGSGLSEPVGGLNKHCQFLSVP